MKMKRILVALPEPLKRKLDTLRTQGTTASGFILWFLEQHFKLREQGRKDGERWAVSIDVQ